MIMSLVRVALQSPFNTWAMACYFMWGGQKLKLFLKNVTYHG